MSLESDAMSEKPPHTPQSPHSSDKQKTPKGHEIPIPKREDVLKDLDKLMRPVPRSPKK